ncbi:hypothetical protein Cni_G19468 [Canna indica]|uniref:Uncharacterized protein n=2 Tax=Canna indica TaxID=4628 RepID=A0AAQ3QGY9_9LILI|nr:hypothetical protein Cni_G19468 [Canna indica]
MDWCSRPLVFLVLVVFLLSASTSRSQRSRPSSGAAVPVPAPAPAPSPDTFCNGVYLSYVLEQREKIHPFTSNPADQPYAFRATATVLNHGTADLLAWTLLVPFRHRELIVSVGGGVLSNGSAFPYNTTLDANSTASPQEMKSDATVALRVQGRKDRHEATGLILHNCTISADASLIT